MGTAMDESDRATTVSGTGKARGGALRRPSLRWRLRGWTVAVFTATLAGSTAYRIVYERRRLVERETEGASALLERLAHTPEMTRSASAARAWLEVVAPALRAQDARIALASASEPLPANGTLLAERDVRFPEGRLQLRYIVLDGRFAAEVRRAIAVHAVHGALTLLLLLVGMEWILRRRLLTPLRQLSHQVHHMGAGGGWQPALPETDAEILEIRSAVNELGPSLAGQVNEWIQGERRAAVALALARLRERLRGPQRLALVLLGDLQAGGAVTPFGKAKARALTREVEALSRIIDEAENEQMPLTRVPAFPGSRSSPPRRSA